MKTKIFLFAVAVGMLAMSCTQVEQGEVALKVYQLGSHKGEIEVLGPGRYALHWFGYFSYKIYPTNLQQWSWLQEDTEKSPGDESVEFQAEGQTLSADIGIEYEFITDAETIIAMYRYFKREPNEIVQDFMRKDVRSAFNKVAESLMVEAVYASKKDSVRAEVQKIMAEKYVAHGIRIKEVTYLSSIRMPDEIKDAISSKLSAKQKAEQRENEVAEKEAEARKLVAEAEGKAEAMRKEAQGRADAIDLEGRALARNPNIIELKRVEAQKAFADNAKSINTLLIPPSGANFIVPLNK